MIKNLLTASLALLSLSTNASLIEITASGEGNMPNGWTEDLKHSNFTSDPTANFFKIKFTEGKIGESITHLSFNLRAGGDTNAYFDPSDGKKDGDVNGGGKKGFGPIVGSGTSDLIKDKVLFSLNTDSPINHILDITFALDVFIVGETLSFGIDIDMLAGQLSDIGGGLIGARSVGVSAITSGGCASSAAFGKDSAYESSAQLCGPQPTVSNVPLPSSSLLVIAGLLALQQSNKRLRLKKTINVLA